LDRKNKPNYEPPMARDLSSISAEGQMPMGLCIDGASPAPCGVGNSPGGTCEFGVRVDATSCETGYFYASRTCFGGTSPVDCISGSSA